MDVLTAGASEDAVAQKVFALRRRLDEYEAHLLPGVRLSFLSEIRILIDCIEETHQEERKYLQEVFSSEPDLLRSEITAYSQISLRILSNIHEKFIPLLHSSSQEGVHAVQQAIQRVIRQLETRDKLELALIPQFEYTYGLTWLPSVVGIHIKMLKYRNKKKERAQLRRTKRLPKWTAFLAYPIVEKESALNLVAIVHELAHLVDFVQGLENRCLPITLDRQSFNKLVRHERKSSAQSGQSKRRIDQQVVNRCLEQCVPMTLSWLREIIADIIAVHALGPAYLFTFHEFLAHSGCDDAPDSEHPAPSTRLRIIVLELTYLGYFDHRTSIISTLESARKKIETEPFPDLEGASLVAHCTLNNHLARIQAVIRRAAAPYAYKASSYASQVPPVTDQLRACLVPVGSSDNSGITVVPHNLVAIINGGWELYTQYRDEFYDRFVSSTSECDRLFALNQLLFKAVEASEVVRMWKTRR